MIAMIIHESTFAIYQWIIKVWQMKPRRPMSSFLLWMELSCCSTFAPTRFVPLFCADAYSSEADTIEE